MAKRYIKRYYIRPQNIFCSNKAEILNALVKEVGENNCSVYSLKALDDHDDVHLLQPKDIIYYYDDGILYDKNHVKVMDYDLNVKHEEERKRFGNVDAISDQTFDAEYEDRLTEAHYDPADYWDEDPDWMYPSRGTKSVDWDIINKARKQRRGQGYTTYGKASKAAVPSGTYTSIYAACDPQKAKEAFEKRLSERKLDVRNFHAAYDSILEDEGILGVFNKDGVMKASGVYGQIKECKNYKVKALLTKFWVAQFKDKYEIYYGTFGESLTEAVKCSKEELEDIFKTVLRDSATLEEIRNLGIAEFNIESDTALINKLMSISFDGIFIEPNSNHVYGHTKFENNDHKAAWVVLRNKALAIVAEKDKELRAIEQEKAKENQAKIAAAKEAELALRKAKDTLPEETIKAEAEKAAKQDFNKHIVDLYNRIDTDIKKARDSSRKHGSKWDIRELTPVEIWAKLRFYENFNDDIYIKDTWGDEAGRYKPLFNIYYYLEYKKLKDIRTLNGRTANVVRDLFVVDEDEETTTNPEVAKNQLKEWLINNISYIEFIVPTGNVAEVWEGDFDAEVIEKINEHFIDIQHRLFKDYNIKGVEESLYHEGTTTIGKNISIRWRNAEKIKVEPVLNWYLTEWQLASNIVFKTPAKDFPASLKKLASNLRVSKADESKLISSNSFVYAIIHGLFENNLNFLGTVTKADTKVEAINPFDLTFESINAYGENLTEAVHNTFICCICGEESEGYGNNPDPVRSSGECCDACNRKFVIPARLGFDIED